MSVIRVDRHDTALKASQRQIGQISSCRVWLHNAVFTSEWKNPTLSLHSVERVGASVRANSLARSNLQVFQLITCCKHHVGPTQWRTALLHSNSLFSLVKGHNSWNGSQTREAANLWWLEVMVAGLLRRFVVYLTQVPSRYKAASLLTWE